MMAGGCREGRKGASSPCRRVEPIRVDADETATSSSTCRTLMFGRRLCRSAGFDIAGAAGTIAGSRRCWKRRAGVLIVYLQNGWDEDYIEAGGPVPAAQVNAETMARGPNQANCRARGG